MESPKLMTVIDALNMAESLLEAPDKDLFETLRLTTPSRPPEDSMALCVAFMTLASSSPGGTGFGFDSKPMKCAQEVKNRSEYVNQAYTNPLPRDEVTRLLDLLGSNPFAPRFLDAVASDPKTLHPSVDLALTMEAVRRLMRDEIDHVIALTKMRQILSVMRRP
jgi:hypothetical protein